MPYHPKFGVERGGGVVVGDFMVGMRSSFDDLLCWRLIVGYHLIML